jgi:hypothetical protein
MLSYTKQGGAPGGPGSLPFGRNNTFVDKAGKLHLRVQFDDSVGRWTNGQIYMCAGNCTHQIFDGWADAVKNQAKLTFGKFSWLVEKIDDGGVDDMDDNLVLGLYTYKANMLDCDKDADEVTKLEAQCSCGSPCDGNVDTSNEIDVEYANWAYPQNTSTASVWFTTWPQKPKGYSYKTRAAPFMTGIKTLKGPRCSYVDWKSTMIVYATWAVTPAEVEAGVTCTEPPQACNPPNCFEHTVMNGDATQDYVPQTLQTPGINFWVHPGHDAPADEMPHEAVISSFTYEANAPMPTPAPAPTPSSATYKCVNAQCVKTAGGLPKKTCEQLCG